MDRPTAYLISCSDHYGHRLRLLDEQLKKLGYDTTYITSDFDHTSKKFFSCDVPGCIQLHVIPYYKNLSARRIVSHWQFARKVYSYLGQLDKEPDVVAGLLPPNSLAYYLAKYKRHHRQVKLLFDVFDLWPETFPAAKVKKLLTPVFSVWAKLRSCGLPEADFVITECELFREKLGLSSEKSAAVYLTGTDMGELCAEPVLQDDRWDLCYLGAVNNVIGISEICGLVGQLQRQKPVTVHIIGTGERINEFAASLRETGATAVCHGPVYEDQRKQEIIHRCHFGLNIVHREAFIGLTMKSVEYFRQGLPVINNVPADTRDLLEQYGAGIQLGQDTAQILDRMTADDCMIMRKNVRNLFDTVFSQDTVRAQYQAVLETVTEGQI